jgi:hypothetical protein
LHYEGGYEDFERYRAGQTLLNSGQGNIPKEIPAVAKPIKPASSGMSKNEALKIKNRCDFLENEIHRLEALLETNRNELGRPEIVKDYQQFKQLSDLHEELSSSLDQLYSEWEKNLALLGN